MKGDTRSLDSGSCGAEKYMLPIHYSFGVAGQSKLGFKFVESFELYTIHPPALPASDAHSIFGARSFAGR